jgi:hypothetical protein
MLGFPSVAEFLAVVVKKIPTLRRLEDIEDEEASVVSHRLSTLTNLVELKLSPIGYSTSYLTFAPLTKLEMLAIKWPWSSHDWAGLAALTHLSRLQHFSIRNANILFDDARGFLSRMTQLRTLVLESQSPRWETPKMPTQWVNSLFKDTPCPNLEHLSVGFSNDPGRLDCFKGYSRLRTLHLTTEFPHQYAHQYQDIAQLSTLTELAVTWHEFIPVELLVGMTSLQSLILTPVKSVRDLTDGEQAVFQTFKNLRSIFFRLRELPGLYEVRDMIKFFEAQNTLVSFERRSFDVPLLPIKGMYM